MAKLDDLIEMTYAKCASWLDRDEEDNMVLVDPIEGKVIGHHYSLSHFAAAAICGFPDDSTRFRMGLEVLHGVLARWDRDSLVPGFHNDFNTFALVLIHDELEMRGICSGERAKIEQTVLKTRDSDHDTVNWLPMRLMADVARTRWGRDNSREANACRKKIARAVNSDGLIEDRLPRGTSFNLQYDISSVALLDYVETCDIEQPVDLDRAYGAITACALPDGDVNYLGRGCNQVFAWGPWVYLLKRRGTESEQISGLGYLLSHLPDMLDNNNILLNDQPGLSRDMWWDYHYCSVYTAHLLMWLVLARRAQHVRNMKGQTSGAIGQTGVKITRNADAMVVTFSGRREYLAESGPEIAAIWTRRDGVINKGAFGPWLGAFGRSHATASVLLNHFGLLAMHGGLRNSIMPLHALSEVKIVDDELLISFRIKRRQWACMNLPLFNNVVPEHVQVSAHGSPVLMRRIGSLMTQYGLVPLYQTNPAKACDWLVKISL